MQDTPGQHVSYGSRHWMKAPFRDAQELNSTTLEAIASIPISIFLSHANRMHMYASAIMNLFPIPQIFF